MRKSNQFIITAAAAIFSIGLVSSANAQSLEQCMSDFTDVKECVLDAYVGDFIVDCHNQPKGQVVFLLDGRTAGQESLRFTAMAGGSGKACSMITSGTAAAQTCPTSQSSGPIPSSSLSDFKKYLRNQCAEIRATQQP